MMFIVRRPACKIQSLSHFCPNTPKVGGGWALQPGWEL
jgi:hypothetical protein